MTTEKQSTTPAVVDKTVADSVLKRVNEFVELGQLVLPKDYSAANAIRAAHLMLLDVKTKDGKPVLSACTNQSIANAMLKMVTEGLSAAKRQGSFIAYGENLTWQREYAGTIALAKRVAGVKDVTANVIYEGDVFEYEIDPVTGRKKVIKHEQKIQNIDINKIVGAYATVMFDDDSTKCEIMTMLQIMTAWNQGFMKGGSPAHKNFTDQMAMKTVINRACKLEINSSDDEEVMDGVDNVVQASREVISEKANREAVTFEDAQVVDDPAPSKSSNPEQKEESKGPGF
jgi:recombination protein RecT